jgi:hypothetical protein
MSAQYMALAQQQSQAIIDQSMQQLRAQQMANVFGLSNNSLNNPVPYYEKTDYERALMELDEEFPGLRE